MNKKNFFIVFLLIAAIGAFLRLYKLGETSFTADEFLGVNTAYGYLKTGEWRRWDFNLNKVAEDKAYPHTFFDLSRKEDAESGEYTRAWMYNWQIAQILRFLPWETESSFRLASALWGIISIFVVYFIATSLTKRKTIGLISAFLFAVNVSAVIFDRKVRMYSMFFPTYLVFSYLFYQFLESGKAVKNKIIGKIKDVTGLNIIYLLPLAVFGLLSFHLHLLAVNIFVAIAAYLAVNAWLSFKKKRVFFNRYIVYLLVAISAIILAVVFIPDIMGLFFSAFEPTSHYSYLNKVLFDYSNGLLALAVMVLGIFYLWKNRQKEGVFLAASFLAPLLMAVFFWNRNAGDQYIFFIKSFQIILLASGIYFLAKFFQKSFAEKGRAAYFATLATLLFLLPNYAYFFQENNPYRQTSRSDDPDYRKVFAYFLKNKKLDDVLVTRGFRNYYFPKANVKLITFGGERSDKSERKVTAGRLAAIQKENPCGWLIWSDNDDDYITGDAKDYIRKNFEQINDIQVRGPITVNYWCNRNN